MSHAKFAAVKELIEEKQYDAARLVLKTINDPKAQDWLKKLEKLSPEFPESKHVKKSEQDEYYARENRKAARRRFGSGIELVLLGIFCFFVFAFFAMPKPNLETGMTEINIGYSWIILILGILSLLLGLGRILKPRG